MALITPPIAAFIEGPNSIMVASHDADLVPEIARAIAVRCAPDGQHVTVVLPTLASHGVIQQLQADPRIAIVLELSSTHRTLQIKGRVVSQRATPDAERALVEQAVLDFAAVLEQIGMPRRLTERLIFWPATSLEVQVDQLFEQSPGPGAGEPLPEGKTPGNPEFPASGRTS
jgi:hypothetical protein